MVIWIDQSIFDKLELDIWNLGIHKDISKNPKGFMTESFMTYHWRTLFYMSSVGKTTVIIPLDLLS